MELRAGVPEQILLTRVGVGWVLTAIKGFDGSNVGTDGSGAALEYPLAMAQIPGTPAWFSPSVVINTAGKYLAIFADSNDSKVYEPLEVLSSVSSTVAGSTPNTGIAYASVGDLIQRYGAVEIAELGDPSIPAVVTSAMIAAAAAGDDLSGYSREEQDAISAALTNLQAALEDCAVIIDGFLRVRYSLPIENPPRTLVRFNCELARFQLCRGGEPEHVRKRNDAVLALLERIARGEVDLGLKPDGATPVAAEPEVRARQVKRHFDPCALRGWE